MYIECLASGPRGLVNITLNGQACFLYPFQNILMSLVKPQN